jgi:hypothetical protein
LGLRHCASSGQRDTLDLETRSGMGGAGPRLMDPWERVHCAAWAGPSGRDQSQGDQASWLDSSIRRQS